MKEILYSLKKEEDDGEDKFKKTRNFFLDEILTYPLSIKIGNAIKQEIEY